MGSRAPHVPEFYRRRCCGMTENNEGTFCLTRGTPQQGRQIRQRRRRRRRRILWTVPAEFFGATLCYICPSSRKRFTVSHAIPPSAAMKFLAFLTLFLLLLVYNVDTAVTPQIRNYRNPKFIFSSREDKAETFVSTICFLQCFFSSFTVTCVNKCNWWFEWAHRRWFYWFLFEWETW